MTPKLCPLNGFYPCVEHSCRWWVVLRYASAGLMAIMGCIVGRIER